ncbi:unnamed protein product [Adineta ricciae]|uniref:G-protein coupled receptors family 1 profile domain-containing protein n=1 Tax=Adineta ricciae TaxID=249248 RepID=A0A816EYZ4_ADIRI|nr:unnamed protein product [Adineta ricciae]
MHMDLLADVYSATTSRTQSPLSISMAMSNETSLNNDSTKTIIPEQYQVILLSFAYGIISLLAVVGNSSIIYIVIRNRHMHSVTNYFICNLALADCLVACFAVPFQFQAAALQKWVLPHFLCKLAPFVQILSVDVSIYTLVAVSLDRYHVMLHPLKPKLSTKTAFLIFIIIWLVAFASSSPSLFFYNVYFIDDYGYQCLPYTHENHLSTNVTLKASTSFDIHKIYIVYNIYSQYVIPFVIISGAYFRIGSHLYFSEPVGQTKYQEVITRNKRKARFNREFRKLYSCLPCIDSNLLQGDLNEHRTTLPTINPIHVRRLTAQQHSPNLSSQARTRQNTTTSLNSIPMSSQSSSIPLNPHQEKRRHFFFSNRQSNHLLAHPKNSYYSCKLNRSINNCEKFLLEQDLANSAQENDLLLIHSTRFV